MNDTSVSVTRSFRVFDALAKAKQPLSSAEIARLIAADDVLLVKGSNSIGLARVIEALASGDMMP